MIHELARSDDRDEAARTLARWLREETARDAADARGNVPNLIEALGEVGNEIASSALVDALEDERHDLASKTLIVQQLARLDHGDRERALPAVMRFARDTEDAPVHDDFEAALRREALAAADETGRRLRL